MEHLKMEADFKNSYTEMWILCCLNRHPMTVLEMMKVLEEESDGVLKIAYPVAFIYKLEQDHSIQEVPHEGKYRRFEITDSGREYLSKLRACHELLAQKNHALLKSMETEQAVCVPFPKKRTEKRGKNRKKLQVENEV